MNVLANILKILIVLVALGAIAFVLMLGVMVLVPSVSIFGIHYVNGDSKVVISSYDIEDETNSAQWASVNTFAITTDSWDVRVYSVDSTNENRTAKGIDARLSRRYNGFAKNTVKEATMSEYKFETRNGVNYLSLSTTEPSGWLSKFDCVLTIYVGADTLQNKKLLIQSNTGRVVVGEAQTNRSTTLNFDNVEVVTKGGTTDINDVNINDKLKITKGSGDINLNTALTCDVNLAITSGLGNIGTSMIGSETKSCSLVIESLYNCGVTMGNVFGDLLVKNASTGIIKGGKVTGTVAFEGSNCNLTLTEANKTLYFNSKDGSLNVKNANDVVAEITGSGGVNVEELKGVSVLKLNSGSINVDNVYANLTAGTVNGNITLNNAENKTVNFVLESTNGQVSVTNVRGSVHFNVNSNGRSSFYGSYKQLIGENVINTNSGEINIDMLDAGYGFLFKDWYTKSTVYLKLSGLEEFTIKDSSADDTKKNGVYIGGYTGVSDTLSVRSNIGKLHVVHPDLLTTA